jgi:hypothetical protein
MDVWEIRWLLHGEGKLLLFCWEIWLEIAILLFLVKSEVWSLLQPQFLTSYTNQRERGVVFFEDLIDPQEKVFALREVILLWDLLHKDYKFAPVFIEPTYF